MRSTSTRNNPPPWKVPRRRKSRGRINFYYDFGDEALKLDTCEEIFIQNRFQPLVEEDSTNTRFMDNEDLRTMEEDNIGSQQERSPEHIPFINTDVNNSFSESSSFDNYMIVNSNCLDNNNYFMYNKNKNFCSGYFPDFITLDDTSYYQLSNGNNSNFYYLYIKNGKYLKYLSNKNSKYNNQYFNDMNYVYRVSKKHSRNAVISNSNGKIDNLDSISNSRTNIPRNSEKGALGDGQAMQNSHYVNNRKYYSEGNLDSSKKNNKYSNTPRNSEKGALEGNQLPKKFSDHHNYSDHHYYSEGNQYFNKYYDHNFDSLKKWIL